MNNKRAKGIKLQVAEDMYVGDGVTLEDIKKDTKSVYASSDFKPVYRSAKKNYIAKKRTQSPKHMAVNTEYDLKAEIMCFNRTGKRHFQPK